MKPKSLVLFLVVPILFASACKKSANVTVTFESPVEGAYWHHWQKVQIRCHAESGAEITSAQVVVFRDAKAVKTFNFSKAKIRNGYFSCAYPTEDGSGAIDIEASATNTDGVTGRREISMEYLAE